MTIYAARADPLVPTRLLLQNASAQTIVSAAGKGTLVLAKIRLVNITSGAVTASLDIYDGTTAQPLFTAKSVPANDAIEFYDEVLPAQSLLRGSAAANTSIWVHVLHTVR